MRLGGPERCVQAGLVDRAVDHGRRRPGGRESAPRRRRDDLGRGDVEAALEREDVSLEPGEELHSRPEPGVRQLREVGVQVDHAGQDDPRTDVDRGGKRVPWRARSRTGIRQPAVRSDDQQAIVLMARPTVIERRQQACAHPKRRAIRELATDHGGRG